MAMAIATPAFWLSSAPTLVAEVLSPATSAYDRGAKFAAYRKLPSLREYVLIDPERLSVDVFRRDGDGGADGGSGPWVLYPYEDAGAVVDLASVGLRLPLAQLYEDVALQVKSASSAHPASAGSYGF